MSKSSAQSITRTLSGASYSLVVSGKKQRLWWIPLTAILISGAVYAFMPNQASPEVALRAQIEQLKRENLLLAEDVKQHSMSLQHEQATREALERQLASQGEDLKKARKDLSFYRGNTVSQGQ